MNQSKLVIDKKQLVDIMDDYFNDVVCQEFGVPEDRCKRPNEACNIHDNKLV